MLWALPAWSLIAISCKKTVDVNIDDSPSLYVIEGKLNNSGGCSVLISLTQNYKDSSAFKGVDSAVVTITPEGGAPFKLKEMAKGQYLTYYKGIPGKTYQLQVNVGGQQFTASSTMPQVVELNEVNVTYEKISGDSRYVANATYSDPAAQANYYNFIQTVNRKRAGAVFINEDHLTNGSKVTFPLLYEGNLADSYSSDIRKGDTVQVEMQCIDPVVYKYWYSLKAGASGESIMATPANPVTNITGGALGYFSAYTSQSKKVIVK
ncbi:hypothetical protein FLA_4040 [Filimonas lacunae]|nr:hypothetical protein FLA_4040 [Filimonas lacunae]